MSENTRIVIIDDDPGIRDAYRDILAPDSASDILAKGSALFGDSPLAHDSADREHYELALIENGEQGIRAVEASMSTHTPFAAAFIDMKMPGIDGAETAKRIWAIDHAIKIVIVTAFHEYSPDDIIRVVGRADIFYLRKPFNQTEIEQFARALTQQWNLERERELQQKHLEEDLKAAAQIQQSLLPQTRPNVKNFHFAWRFIPCQTIGGDIFNIHRLDESHLALYMVDVSGHGVPAAMVTVSVSQSLLPGTGHILKKTTNSPPHYEIIPPVDVMKRLDQEYPLDRFGKYFTITYLILNIETGQIRYSGAAHPMPVLVRANGDIELLRKGGTIIGMGKLVPFEEGEVFIRQGDRLVLYTDGIVEYMNEADEEFGGERFYHELQTHRQTSLETTCERVIEAVMAYGSGVKPQDDITLLALERTGGEHAD